jgi:hypothetical protein
MQNRVRPFRFSATLVALSMFAAACGSDSTGPNPADDDVREFITALATVSGQGNVTFRRGSPPAGGAGPVITVSGTSAVILGGTAQRAVTSTTAFSRIVVAVEGVDGYWELTLPQPTNAETLLLTMAQELPSNSFRVRYAGGTTGAVGSFQNEDVTVLNVGTGPIQVSVSWNTSADVDLYLVEPTGTEIYYGQRTSAAGGTLDLDSNAACSGGPRNENITYTAAPPRGQYAVRLNYWSACGATSTAYVVTVRAGTQPPRTFTGTFTGPGEGGASGAGIPITTFTY